MPSDRLACQGDTELVKAVRLLAWLTKSFESACPQSGISLAKYRILLLVSAEPVRVTELAGHARVSLPTLSGLVASLESQGLLERTALRTDRRGVCSALTPAGLEARTRAEEALATAAARDRREQRRRDPAHGGRRPRERARSLDRARPGERPHRPLRIDQILLIDSID